MSDPPSSGSDLGDDGGTVDRVLPSFEVTYLLNKRIDLRGARWFIGINPLKHAIIP